MQNSEQSQKQDNINLELPLEEYVIKLRERFPQLLLIELSAWLDAVQLVGPKVWGGVSLVKSGIEQFFVKNLANGFKSCAIPIYKRMKVEEKAAKEAKAAKAARAKVEPQIEEHAFVYLSAQLLRYFEYVIIDATATSGVMPALYAASLSSANEKQSKLNILYPLLVTTLGTPLKLMMTAILTTYLLIVLPLASIPIAMIGITGYEDHKIKDFLNLLLNTVFAAIGIILTVTISNINPVFLLKTILIDPVFFISAINKINNNIDSQSVLRNRDSSSPLNKICSSNINEGVYQFSRIIATLDTNKQITSKIVIDAKKEYGGGYDVKSKNEPWSPVMGSNRALKKLEFTVLKTQSDTDSILGIINVSKLNIIQLDFNDGIDDHDKVSVAVGFVKMIINMSEILGAEAESITLEAVNCASISLQLLTDNIREPQKQAILKKINFNTDEKANPMPTVALNLA